MHNNNQPYSFQPKQLCQKNLKKNFSSDIMEYLRKIRNWKVYNAFLVCFAKKKNFCLLKKSNKLSMNK